MAITLNGSTGVTTTGLTSNGIDDNATSTAITIDSSENVLVGKTTSSIATAGTALRGDNPGLINSVRAGTILELNRLTTDGSIVDLYKNGSTVGSIATQGSRLSIGSGDVNLNFNASANSMYPISNPTTGALSDGAINVGAATARFKDLYLSGGVYLGGTGAANYLSDVEGGAWVPVLSKTGTAPTYSAVGSGIGATYMKIGSSVTIWFDMNYDMSNAGSGDAFISGLPFAPAVGVANGGYSEVGIRNSTGYNVAAGLPITGYVYLSRIYVEINQSLGTVAANFSAGNGLRITGTCTYKTAA